MKKYYLIHFGIGNVGKTLITQLFENKKRLQREYDIDLQYCGIFSSKGGFYKKTGFTHKEINRLIPRLSTPKITDPSEFIKKMPGSFLEKVLFIDTTNSDTMTPLLEFMLTHQSSVVMSNKKPLAGKIDSFTNILRLGKGRLRFETTVGAGLPVIKIMKELQATGDQILEITGCFSGTLGFICSELEKGNGFAKTVSLAKDKGLTEPDPRDDLYGTDVARKALILGRLLGKKISLTDIAIAPFYIDLERQYSLKAFMEDIQEEDNKFRSRFSHALKKKKTLRYMAKISDKKISVGLSSVLLDSPLGSLKGPDNMIIIKSKRYFQNPLVIRGPGAGLEVTAAGVFGDILSLLIQ